MSSATAADAQVPGTLRRGSGRRLAVLALLGLLLLAVLLPPYVNLKRFRPRMEAAIGGALGRRVTIGSANLRLLPRPGLDLQNFVVYDDPAFSAEPMIRSDDVTASLRLASLWRGRLEIASLSLQYPSLNAVRTSDGRWNIQALVLRASQVPAAPTVLPRAEARPRFPYIEATGARINFKLGQEKTVFSLSDAEFSLWLAREDEWEVRLNARPMRTDFNLSDTGRIRVDGSIRRAAELRLTPVDLHLRLDRAQLGQLTTMIYDRDRGWRGSASLALTLAGTPSDLQVVADLAVNDFRRNDIISGSAYDLQARCTARYSTDTATASNIGCVLPQGDGQIALRGTVSHLLQDRSYDIRIDATDVPLQELVRFAQHAKRDLPADLTALGAVNASFALRSLTMEAGKMNVWTGGGSARDFALRSRTLGPDLAFSPVKFSFQVPPQAGGTKRHPSSPDYSKTQLVLEPFTLPLGGTAPATVRASLSRDGYDVAVVGEATLQSLAQVSDGLGVPIYHPKATGDAHLDIDITGNWAGFAAPLAVGNIQLRDVVAEVPGVVGSLRVAAAVLSLAPDGTSIMKMSATFSVSRVAFDGTVSFPRHCDFGAGCPVRFDLHSDQLVLRDLDALLDPELRNQPWYRFADTGGGGPIPAKFRAEGQVTIGRLLLDSVVANRLSAQVKLADRQLTVSGLQGELFGGKHQGTWHADFTAKVPSYSGRGTVEGMSLALVSAAMHDNWAAGILFGKYEFRTAGLDAAQLLQSATGQVDFQWKDGTLRHLALRGTDPVRFTRFHGRATLQDGKLAFAGSSMESASGAYEVSGTASLGRELALRFSARNRDPITVDGSLRKPRVSTGNMAAATPLKP